MQVNGCWDISCGNSDLFSFHSEMVLHAAWLYHWSLIVENDLPLTPHKLCTIFIFPPALFATCSKGCVYCWASSFFFLWGTDCSGFDNAWLSLTVFSHVYSCVWIVLQICAHPGKSVLIYRIFFGTGCSGGYAYVHKAWLHNLWCEGNLATFQFQNFESS